MTPEQQVPILKHMDDRFEALGSAIRGVHHRLDEMQASNTREHDKVVATLNDSAMRVTAIEVRVDGLEADRDKRVGAHEQSQRVRRIVGAVVLAIVSAIAGALASGLLNPPA